VDRVLEMIRFIRAHDSKRQIVISVDLEKHKPDVEQLLLEDIDVFIVEKEFGRIFEIETAERMMSEMPNRIANPNATIAFPWGAQGAFGVNKRNGQRCSSKSYPPSGQFVDTLGAGDSFTGAFILGLGLLNYRLDQALEFACRVAGAKCSATGFDHLQHSEHLLP
jgi:sugar/nucleoside kinase (ribokinase family)